MIAFCTYCSAEKNKATLPMPAIDLYKSNRIAQIYEQAKKANFSFVIFSGKYGIVSPNELIAPYDHLLITAEVDAHIELIISQIRSLEITEMSFFMNSLEEDPNLKPYLECLERACLKLKIPLRIEIVKLQD